MLVSGPLPARSILPVAWKCQLPHYQNSFSSRLPGRPAPRLLSLMHRMTLLDFWLRYAADSLIAMMSMMASYDFSPKSGRRAMKSARYDRHWRAPVLLDDAFVRGSSSLTRLSRLESH